jgi:putative spermidine/putrescine transport system substrate-binding protein
MTRKILVVAAIIILAGIAALAWYMRPLPILTVTTWAGDYGHAQAAAQMRPYASAMRVDVHLAEWEGDLSDLKGDVIDFELPKAVEACRRGLLEKIDASSLPPGDDGTPAARDFVPGAIGPCWVGSMVYSQVILYAPERFASAEPQSLADFFDTAKFPGRRAMKRGSGKYNLELALLADGVAPKDVYPTLSSASGLARAFHKLDGLGPSLTWYDNDSQALTLLQGGGVAFTTALNGQIYDPTHHAVGMAPGVIWDRQLYEMDVFGVPAGDPRKDMAMDYIRYATGSAPLAGVADWQPYGPARRSGLALVGRNPEYGTQMRNLLPTAHFDTAFAVNDAWWLDNRARADAAWQAWLARSH